MTLLSRIVVALVAICATSLASPVGSSVVPRADDVCTTPKLRRSWHTLKDDEKKAYIDAELCLMSKPSELGLRGSRTRFDDFQVAHALKMEIAHFVGQFLPFHRLFLSAHEEALRNECGYAGAQPYWDEPLDAGHFSKSILLHNPTNPDLTFGGDGDPSRNNCIQTGPFATYTNPIGPGYVINDHCIDRRINDAISGSAQPSVVQACMDKTTWMEFWPCIENRGPHSAGHGGVGMQMLNPVSSPGDPIFFLHHAWLDRLWSKWQLLGGDEEEVRRERFGTMGGINRADLSTRTPPAGGFFQPFNITRPDDVPEPVIVGDPGNTTTLNHVLYLFGITENRTIAEVMDTRGVLCYEYD